MLGRLTLFIPLKDAFHEKELDFLEESEREKISYF
jgi:hypothetical protein